LIETLLASLLIIVGGILVSFTFRGRKRQTSGGLLGIAIIIIGVSAAVDYLYPFSTLLVYSSVVVGCVILAVSVYMMFESPNAATDQTPK
jgi:hypothetical protein